MTTEFTQSAREENQLLRKTQNRHLTMFQRIFERISVPYRRAFGEIEMMLVKKDGADMFAEDTIAKTMQFIQQELVRAELPILFQGMGDVPAEGECYIVNVCGSRVNLVHASPDVMITCAHVKDGEVQCAACYNPITDILYASEKTKGSVASNMRLRVSGREYVEGTLIGLFSPVTRTEDEETYIDLYRKLRQNSVHVRMSGNTMADVINVCAGKLDAYVGLNLSAHDVLIAELFVREAGGYTCEVDGSKVELGSTSFIASNHKYQGRLLKLMK